MNLAGELINRHLNLPREMPAALLHAGTYRLEAWDGMVHTPVPLATVTSLEALNESTSPSAWTDLDLNDQYYLGTRHDRFLRLRISDKRRIVRVAASSWGYGTLRVASATDGDAGTLYNQDGRLYQWDGSSANSLGHSNVFDSSDVFWRVEVPVWLKIASEIIVESLPSSTGSGTLADHVGTGSGIVEHDVSLIPARAAQLIKLGRR